MLDFLRDSAWQGVAGIVAIISLILFIYAERGKLFSKFSISNQKIISTVLMVAFVSSGFVLGSGALLTINAFVAHYGQLWGSIFASILIELGVFIWFTFLCFVFLRNLIERLDIYLGWLLLSLLVWGAQAGYNASMTDSVRASVDHIYAYGAGGFTLGTMMIILTSLTLKPLNNAKSKR